MTRIFQLETLAPALFVLIWSTGWLTGKYVAIFSEPLTMLYYRFIFAVLVFFFVAHILKSKWPQTKSTWFHATISGVFLHAIYLSGVWWAISKGVPTSISGLLAALQPLLTAGIAYWAVTERLSGGQRLGLVLGFVGLLIAIAPGLLTVDTANLAGTLWPLAINVFAMIGVTLGTIYQKRYLQEGDLFPIATLQFVGALIFITPFVFWLESPHNIVWSLEIILILVWSVFGLSLAAISLLLFLIRKGEVSRAASLIYLIPPVVGIEAWFLFDETPTTSFVIGTLIVVVGVWLVNRKSSPS